MQYSADETAPTTQIAPAQKLQIEQNVDLRAIQEREEAIHQLEVFRYLGLPFFVQVVIIWFLQFFFTVETVPFLQGYSLFNFQSDIMDVNQIFKDLALMVHEQGELVGEFCF